jgi:enoyl-CoA hydratase
VYYERVKEMSVTKAFKARDAVFGDGRARVRGPEIRDANGRLVDP